MDSRGHTEGAQPCAGRIGRWVRARSPISDSPYHHRICASDWFKRCSHGVFVCASHILAWNNLRTQPPSSSTVQRARRAHRHTRTRAFWVLGPPDVPSYWKRGCSTKAQNSRRGTSQLAMFHSTDIAGQTDVTGVHWPLTLKFDAYPVCFRLHLNAAALQCVR